MTEQPTIETERLVLRPFTLKDAADVQRLAGDRDIASTTLRIPHPYEDGMAQQWIGTHQEQFEKGQQHQFAITLQLDGTLIGGLGLVTDQTHALGELGYWIGKPYWNQGYATEAAARVLRYGFEVLSLNRIFAAHYTRNPASGRIMEKIGMTYEGCLRQHVNKWGVFEDLAHYGVLRSEYDNSESRSS